MDIRSRNGTKTYALIFYTRSYPFITELRNKFYPEINNEFKGIPSSARFVCEHMSMFTHETLEIYEYLTPPALAHLIMGDGSRRDYGLTLCTDCYTLYDVIRLMNVLIIRYGINSTLQKKTSGRLGWRVGLPRDNQYRIHIRSSSMPLLRSIVTPYMHCSMLYKLGVRNDN